MLQKSKKQTDKTNQCPVCSFLTLGERGMFEICPVCFWEDDGTHGEEHPNEPNDGPNGELRLNKAKQNFKEFGAVEKRLLEFVRPPKPEESYQAIQEVTLILQRQSDARKCFGIQKSKSKIFNP